MQLILDEEQTLLTDTVRQFVRDRSPVSRARALRDSGDETGFSRAVWREMAELGLAGVHIGERDGGAGMGFFDLCLVLECVGRNLAPEPFLSSVLMGAEALMLGADEGARAQWLPKIASGDAVVAFAFDEDGSRYAVERITAELREGRLHGIKRDVLDAHVADALLVTAHAPDGIGVFLVDPAECQITRQHRIDSRNAGRVVLDGVSVEARIGGLDLLRTVVDRATIGLCAEMLGGAQKVFEDTLEYLKTRQQFGTTIGKFQALQHRAARLFAELALARSAVLAAARSVDDAPDQVALMASLAKARVTEIFLHATDEAVQMHGGIGMTDECDVGLYLKRARVCAATFGDAAFHRRRWATLRGY